MFVYPTVNPRRAGRPRLVQGGFDLFEAAASSPPPQAMLDLGPVSGEALDLVGRQRRLLQMERQRDLLRAQGWATADLDAHITALNRSLRDSWRRNPRRRGHLADLPALVAYVVEDVQGGLVPTVIRRDEVPQYAATVPDDVAAGLYQQAYVYPLVSGSDWEPDYAGDPLRVYKGRNPRLPLGSRPAYSGWHYAPRNRMFRGPDGVYHPLRRNLQAQGIYDPEIERRRRQLKGEARRQGWLPAGASGTIRHVVRTTRDRAERRAAEAEAEADVSGGSFEQRYGIARPTNADIRGLRAHLGHPVQDRGGSGSDGSSARPLLSDRDVLRLAAVARQVDPNLNLSQQDWWDDLSWDDYRQAVGKERLSFDPAELGAGRAGTVSGARREAQSAARQATALEGLLDPWEAKRRVVEDRLERALDAMGRASSDAQAKQATRRAERWEAELKSLGRRQRAENPQRTRRRNPRVFDLPDFAPRRYMSVGGSRARIEETPDPEERFYHGARRYTVYAPTPARGGAQRYEGPFTTSTRPGEVVIGTADTYRGALQLAGQAGPALRRSTRARVIAPDQAAQLQLFNPLWRRDNPGALLLAALGAAAVGIAAIVWWRRDKTPDWVRHAALAEHHRQQPTLPEDPRITTVRWQPQGAPPALIGPGWEVVVREAGTEWGYVVRTSGDVTSS